MFRNSKFVAILIAVLVLPTISFALPAEAAVYSAPSLVSPASNQVLTNYPRVATFKWSAVSGASSYQLEIACDTCVSKTNLYANAKTYTVNGTSYTVQVPGADNTFRYRVRAKDSSSYGPWSNYRYFSYNTGSGTSSINTPIINSPANFVSYPAGTNVNFAWTYSGNNSGVSYDFILEKNNGYSWSTFKTMQVWSGNTSTNLKIDEAGSYRFKVSLRNSSNWSGYVYFYIVSDSYNNGNLTLISPSDESTVTNNYVVLDWSDVSGATSYEYQVTRYDNYTWLSVSNNTVSASNASVYLPYGTYGQYSFRARAITNGSYGSWSDYNQFYYYSDNGGNNNYGAPTIYNPYNQTYTSHSVYMSWSAVSGATGYQISVQYESNSNWYEEGTYSTTDPSYTKYFSNDNHYRMRVRSKTGDYSYGTWSEWREFRVGDSENYNNYNAPTIHNPLSGVSYTSQSVYMNWSTISGASSYEINVQYESYGNWYEEGTYSTTNAYYSKYFSNNNEYRLRVRAKFGNNSYGAWSEWRDFNVGTNSGNNSSSVPTINSPYSNQSFSSYSTVNINWSTISGASSYEIGIEYESNGTWYSEGNYTATNANYAKYFSNDNEYRVRVRAKFSDYSYGTWSEWRQFVVGTGSNYSTGAPIVYTPANNAIIQNSNHQVSLSWNGVYNAQSYQIEMVREGYSTETLYPGTATSYTYNASASNSWYHFRVRAYLGNSTYTNWSDWRYFQYYYSTSGNVSSPPIITSPTAGQILSAGNIYFSWLNVSSATGYDIEFGYLSGGNWTTESTYSTTVNYYNRNFTSVNDYHVRVRAKFSDSSTTGWSDWVLFKIQ